MKYSKGLRSLSLLASDLFYCEHDPLPNNKTLDTFKLRAMADDKINIAQVMIVVCTVIGLKQM